MARSARPPTSSASTGPATLESAENFDESGLLTQLTHVFVCTLRARVCARV
jgi:hypothetical protein